MNKELPTTNCGKLPFNLSDRITVDNIAQEVFFKEDVKEYIRLLKKELKDWGTIRNSLRGNSINKIIDKLAGENLK